MQLRGWSMDPTKMPKPVSRKGSGLSFKQQTDRSAPGRLELASFDPGWAPTLIATASVLRTDPLLQSAHPSDTYQVVFVLQGGRRWIRHRLVGLDTLLQGLPRGFNQAVPNGDELQALLAQTELLQDPCMVQSLCRA